MRSLATSRREKAEQEIGRTSISRYIAWGILIFFSATVLLIPVIQFAADIRRNFQNHSTPDLLPSGEELVIQFATDIRRGSRNYSILDLLPSKQELAAVRGIRSLLALLPSLKEINDYESALEDGSVVSNWIMPHVQHPLTRVLHAGNEKVYPGRDSWLFYRPDMDYIMGRGFLDPAHLKTRSLGGESWEQPPQPDPLRAILDFNRRLRERGIRLIVMPTPVKATIHPEMFSARHPSPAHPLQNLSYYAFVDRLEEADITIFDVSQALLDESQRTGKAQYLKTDTHWTPAAMELAAAHLAELIRANVELSESDATFYQQNPMEMTNLGDIAGMLKLPADQSIFSQEQVTIHAVKTSTDDYWTPERDTEILILGDSFSNIYSLEGMGWGTSAGFTEQLSAEMKLPVDRLIINAGGAYTTRQALFQELKRGDDRLAGKRVVVYQFAARELFSGDWRLYELPAPEAKPAPVAERKDSAVIRAMIKDKTEPPRPGTVPYKDCVIALHLTDIRTEDVSFPIEEVVVFLWGMRDDEWTKATSLKIGREVKLSVQPWGNVEDRYGSYNRKELDSEESWFMDVYWGEITQ